MVRLYITMASSLVTGDNSTCCRPQLRGQCCFLLNRVVE